MVENAAPFLLFFPYIFFFLLQSQDRRRSKVPREAVISSSSGGGGGLGGGGIWRWGWTVVGNGGSQRLGDMELVASSILLVDDALCWIWWERTTTAGSMYGKMGEYVWM